MIIILTRAMSAQILVKNLVAKQLSPGQVLKLEPDSMASHFTVDVLLDNDTVCDLSAFPTTIITITNNRMCDAVHSVGESAPLRHAGGHVRAA